MSVARTRRGRLKRRSGDRSSSGKVLVSTQSILPALVCSGVAILCFYQDVQIGIGALIASPMLFLLSRSAFEGLSTAIKLTGRKGRGEKPRRLRRSSKKFSTAKASISNYSNVLPALVILAFLILSLEYEFIPWAIVLISLPLLFVLFRLVLQSLSTPTRFMGRKRRGEKPRRLRRSSKKFSTAKALVFTYSNVLPALVTVPFLMVSLQYGFMFRVVVLISSPLLFVLFRLVLQSLSIAIRVIVVRLIRVTGQKSQREGVGQGRRRRRRRR